VSLVLRNNVVIRCDVAEGIGITEVSEDAQIRRLIGADEAAADDRIIEPLAIELAWLDQVKLRDGDDVDFSQSLDGSGIFEVGIDALDALSAAFFGETLLGLKALRAEEDLHVAVIDNDLRGLLTIDEFDLLIGLDNEVEPDLAASGCGDFILEAWDGRNVAKFIQ